MCIDISVVPLGPGTPLQWTRVDIAAVQMRYQVSFQPSPVPEMLITNWTYENFLFLGAFFERPFLDTFLHIDL